MLSVISPAKTLDFCDQELTSKATQPEFLDDSNELVDTLSGMTRARLKKLMSISDKLADLNHERYQEWSTPFNRGNSKQALLAFKGDVYTGFDCEDWTSRDFDFAQKHLRILSGLHGVLRPLDLIQAYRLEMGTDLKTARGKNLYAFWGTKVTMALGDALKEAKAKALVNLASNEYFSVIKPELLDQPVVTPVFKDWKNGQFKILSFFAKKARGSMANFIVRERVKAPEGLKDFDVDGYSFAGEGKRDGELLFHRKAG
ncbi:MAG: peroxide stress protein YaaA [Verrucomicrobiota bacterium]